MGIAEITDSRGAEIRDSHDGIAADVRSRIVETSGGVAGAVNTGITVLYWRIGKRMLSDVLKNDRAEHVKKTVSTLSRQLTDDFKRGIHRRDSLNGATAASNGLASGALGIPETFCQAPSSTIMPNRKALTRPSNES